MKDIIAFVRKFTKSEYEAIVASLTEPNADRAGKKIHALDAFFDGMSSDLQRDENLDADEVESNRSQLEWKQERHLFQVKEYAAGKRHLFRAYVSDTDKPPTDEQGYFSSLFVRGNGQPKIVAQYNICVSCGASGKVGTKPCGDCKGAGWVWRGGERIDVRSLGKPIAVQKIEAPSDARFVNDYKAE